MRLIDADAKIMAQLYDDEHEEWVQKEMTVADYLSFSDTAIPFVDAVPVVRCAECEKWRPGYITENDDFVSPYCTVFNTPMLSNDYCAYPTPKGKDGQRREDGDA